MSLTPEQINTARAFAAFDVMDQTQADIHNAAAKLRDSGSPEDAVALSQLLNNSDDVLLTARQKKAKYMLRAEKP